MLKKNPLLAGFLGVVLLAISAVLLQQTGVLFVIGFCLLALGITNLYILARGIVHV